MFYTTIHSTLLYPQFQHLFNILAFQCRQSSSHLYS